MKIVVTGATGLLGNATAKHLIAKGHEVVPVDRRDGEVAPGPDYKIYLTSKFVDDKDSFLAIKKDSQKVAEVNGFKNFRTMLPASTKVNDYTAVVIWCERFEKFITAGKLNIEG